MTTHPLYGRLRASLLLLLMASLAACGSDGDAGEDNDIHRPDGDDVTEGEEDVFVPVEESAFRVSFNRRSRLTADATNQLLVVSSDCLFEQCTEEPIVVGGEGFECAGQSCELTDSLDYVVFQTSDESQPLFFAPLTEGLQLSEARTQIAESVTDFLVREDRVVYQTLDLDLGWFEISTGRSGTFGNLLDAGDGRERAGGFAFSDDGRWVVAYAASLSTLRTTIFDFEDPSTPGQRLYRFVSGSPTSAGSAYSGSEATAISPDGNWVVVHTTQIVLGEPCGGGCPANVSCVAESEPSRCGSNRTLLNVIHRPDSGLLGGGCARDSDCGRGHQCDLTFITPSTQQGTCRPGRLDLGPRDGFGCDGILPGEYTTVPRHIFWTPDNRVAFLATDLCNTGGANAVTPSTVRLVDPETRATETIVDTPGEAFPGPDCLDQVTFEYQPSQCISTFRAMRPSPSGQQALLLGSTLTTDRSDAIWLIDLFGNLPRRLVSNVLDAGEPDAWQIVRFRAHP